MYLIIHEKRSYNICKTSKNLAKLISYKTLGSHTMSTYTNTPATRQQKIEISNYI